MNEISQRKRNLSSALLGFVLFVYYILIFSLGFMQPYVYFSDVRIPATEFIFLACFALWILYLIAARKFPRKGNLYIPLALYLSAFIISTIFSTDFRTSAVKVLGEIYLFFLAVLTFNLIDSKEKMRRIVKIWLAATFVCAIISAISFILFYVDRSNTLLIYTLSHYGTLPPGNYPRVQSSFLNPNMLCNYLTVGFVMLFAAAKLKYIGRVVFYFLLVFISFAAALTISPGLGAFFLAAGFWLNKIFKEKKQNSMAHLSFAGGIAAAIVFFLASVFTPIPTETSPFYLEIPFIEKRIDPSSRVIAWQTSIETFAVYPIFGKGVGTDVANARFLNPSGSMETLTDAHQMWLNVAGQTGIFGFIALCFLCFYFYRRAAFSNLDGEQNTLQTAFGIAFIGAFLYQGLTGSFENARHLWVLMGLLASVAASDFSKTEQNG
jgi:hypothetical protein